MPACPPPITVDFQLNSDYSFDSVQRDRPQLSKLMKFRSRCPLASVLDLIGDKWSLLVLRDLYLGRTLFSEFEESWEGISPAVLSDRLKAMENTGLVKRS